ncbi:MAG TPA: hypothetical protein VEC56_01105, partial [Candidatus Krumholzibacteria bacterium]|nr:hypothetical protein [Candidatus Krumholzibacteria bacterium]
MLSLAPRILVLVTLSVLAGCASAPPNVAGDWVGGIRVGTTWHAAHVTIDHAHGLISGRADVKALGVVDAPLEGSLDGRRVRFRVAAGELNELWFEGREEEDALRSDVHEWRGPA